MLIRVICGEINYCVEWALLFQFLHRFAFHQLCYAGYYYRFPCFQSFRDKGLCGSRRRVNGYFTAVYLIPVQYPHVGFVSFAFTENGTQGHYRHGFFQERTYIGREADAARETRFHLIQGMVESGIVDGDRHRDTRTVRRDVEIFLQFGIEDVSAVCIELHAEVLVFGTEQIKVSIGDGELDAQFLGVDQLHNAFARVHALIVLH